ncbi:hypothetical protein CR513_23930, partial [Mucuna pruriens]
MILRDDGNIDSESSHEEVSTLGSEGYSSEEVSYEGDLRMVNVKLTLGKYKDEILCGVIPMEATYILFKEIVKA